VNQSAREAQRFKRGSVNIREGPSVSKEQSKRESNWWVIARSRIARLWWESFS
jgi:hypothetical protein